MHKNFFRSFAALLVTAVFAANASAAVVTYTINMQYTGDTPDGYLVLEFSDEAGGLAAGEVKMTLTSFLSGNENVKTLGFNFEPGLGNESDDSDAVDSLVVGTPMVSAGTYDTSAWSVSTGLDGVKGDLGPVKGLDVVIGLHTGNSPDSFNNGDVIMSILSADIPLTADMFDAANENGVGAAAHIQNTDGREGSGKIKDGGTPEIPAPAALPAGLALIGVVAARRRRAA